MAKKKTTSVVDDIYKNKEKMSDHQQTSELLMDDRFKRRKTILTNAQVPRITTIDVMAQIYDVSFLKFWIEWYAEWRTSGDKGKGRQDLVDISKFRYDEQKNLNAEILGVLRGK